MTEYLLSTHSVADDGAPTESQGPDPDEMQAMMQRIIELEAAMDDSGVFLFGGGLHGIEAASVVDASTTPMITDGPFAESKEHIAGFYVIRAADLDEALEWARRVSACIGRPIEVRPFAGTGRVADQFPSS